MTDFYCKGFNFDSDRIILREFIEYQNDRYETIISVSISGELIIYQGNVSIDTVISLGYDYTDYMLKLLSIKKDLELNPIEHLDEDVFLTFNIQNYLSNIIFKWYVKLNHIRTKLETAICKEDKNYILYQASILNVRSDKIYLGDKLCI